MDQDRAGLYANAPWESAALERPVGDDEWTIPGRVELVGNRLLWWPRAGPMAPLVKSRRGLLRQFEQLADASGDRIVKYARRWGILGLCRHGLPMGFRRSGYPWWHEDECALGLYMDYGDGGTFWEPLEGWRHWARQARGLLGIAASHRDGRLGRDEDWRAVREWGNLNAMTGLWTVEVDKETGELTRVPETPPQSRWPRTLDWERSELIHWVTDWLRLANVTLGLRSAGSGLRVVLDCNGLFGALAIQLVLVVGHSRGIAFCAHCSRPFLPAGSSGGGKRRYCDRDECKKARGADAARDYRRTPKGQAAYHAQVARRRAKRELQASTGPG
jgi:hypothetical protein